MLLSLGLESLDEELVPSGLGSRPVLVSDD
jgi:hypothetical protein